MTIVVCCAGMQFAVREKLFQSGLGIAYFDSGEAANPRMLVTVKFCPWCGKVIEVDTDDRRGER